MIFRLRIFFIVSLVTCLGLSGCSVNPGFNQLDLLVRWSKYKTKAELEAQLWTAKIGEYEEIAIPVVHDQGITFYMKDGTEIEFSGWDVTAFRNWNRYGKSTEINRAGAELTHLMFDGGETALVCTEYIEVPKTEEYKVLLEAISQTTGEESNTRLRVARCDNKLALPWSYSNAVLMDDQGRAIWMLHYVSPEMPPLEMRLNGSDLPQDMDAAAFVAKLNES